MRQYNSIHLAWHGAVGRLLFGFVLWSCLVALWRPPCAWAEEAGLKTETIIGARSVSGTVFWDVGCEYDSPPIVNDRTIYA